MEIHNDLMIRIREADRRASARKITYVVKSIIGILLMYSVAVLFMIAFWK